MPNQKGIICAECGAHAGPLSMRCRHCIEHGQGNLSSLLVGFVQEGRLELYSAVCGAFVFGRDADGEFVDEPIIHPRGLPTDLRIPL